MLGACMRTLVPHLAIRPLNLRRVSFPCRQLFRLCDTLIELRFCLLDRRGNGQACANGSSHLGWPLGPSLPPQCYLAWLLGQIPTPEPKKGGGMYISGIVVDSPRPVNSPCSPLIRPSLFILFLLLYMIGKRTACFLLQSIEW